MAYTFIAVLPVAKLKLHKTVLAKPKQLNYIQNIEAKEIIKLEIHGMIHAKYSFGLLLFTHTKLYYDTIWNL